MLATQVFKLRTWIAIAATRSWEAGKRGTREWNSEASRNLMWIQLLTICMYPNDRLQEGRLRRCKKIQEAYTLHLQRVANVQVETKTFEPKNLYSISISNQENNEVTINSTRYCKVIRRLLPLVVELSIKTIYVLPYFFHLYLLAFISSCSLWLGDELYYIWVIFLAYWRAGNIHVWESCLNTNKTFVFSWYFLV